MRFESFTDAVRDPAAVVTTGTFDGVHVGHQAILRYLVERARAIGGTPTMVTFDPHPREVISGEHVPLLTTIEERAGLSEGLGIERMVVVPFTPALAALEPETYVQQVLLDRVGLREAVVGFDHHFGRARRGNRALLEELGSRHGFTVDVIPEQVYAGSTVSSRRIRQLLVETGDVAAAAELLGRSYSLEGIVVAGDGRGRSIGYPTANLEAADSRKIVPATGVYAVGVELPGGREAGGMMNVGMRPTFAGEGTRRAEVHVFELDEDLYGQPLRVRFVERLRDERRFDGVEALKHQLGEDRRRALAVLGR